MKESTRLATQKISIEEPAHNS